MPSFLLDVSHHNSLKYKVGRSFCSSYRHNVRNLERPWYGLWCQILTDLTEQFDNMIVIPQFPLWHIPREDDSEDEKETSDNGVDGVDELDCLQMDEDNGSEHGDGDGVGNITTDSIVTVADGNAAELFPDFVIIHLLAKHLPANHPHFTRLGGIQITHQCCSVIVENKKAPSRKLRGGVLRRAVDALLDSAQEQLGTQCYQLFMQYPNTLSTIAIAAAGDHWTFRKVHRFEIPRAIGDTLDFSGWERLKWPQYATISSPESDERFREIYEILDSKPLLHLD